MRFADGQLLIVYQKKGPSQQHIYDDRNWMLFVFEQLVVRMYHDLNGVNAHLLMDSFFQAVNGIRMGT